MFQHRTFLNNLFFGISSDVPYSWLSDDSIGSKRHLFLAGALPTFIFCFLMTAIFCAVEGVLWPSGEFTYEGLPYDHVPLLSDGMNLFFYAVLNPVLMGCSVILWVAALKARAVTADSDSDPAREPRMTLRSPTLLLSTTLVVTFSTLAVSNYINDIASHSSAVSAGRFYWFHGHAEIGALRPITVHYMLLNFVLLSGALITTGFFLTSALRVIRLASIIPLPKGGERIPKSDLRRRCGPFWDVYVSGRIIVYLTMIHVLVWSRNEQLSNTENQMLEFAFVLGFGVFFVAVPRFYIESEWKKIVLAAGPDNREGAVTPDIPAGRWTRLSAHAADTLVIGGFVLGWTLT